jgi:cardiolipin synthase
MTLALIFSSQLAYAGNTDAEGRNRTNLSLFNGMRFTKHLVRGHTVDVVKSQVTSVRDLASLTLRSGEAWVTRADIRFRATNQLNKKPIPAIANGGAMDLEEWSSWLDKRVAVPRTEGSIDFLVDGEQYFPRLKAAIEEAEESINLQTYIFDNDDVALGYADLLKKRSEELPVRVLYDGFGTITAQSVMSSSLPMAHREPLSVHSYLVRDSKVKVRRSHNRWLMGDHCKNTIIDRKVAFVGGMNVGREYRHDWHDLMAELQGPVVEVLNQHFEDGWQRAGKGEDLTTVLRAEKKRATLPEGNRGIWLLRTTPTCREIQQAQLEALRRAKRYVYVQNAYLADDQFVHELCKARKRGVDVRVIMPAKNDIGIMHAGNKVSANRLLKNGVRVYMHPQMTHIKAAIYDGWVCFGTANYDKLSLTVNREINLATVDPEVADRLLRELFYPDMEASTELMDRRDLTVMDHIVELISDET